MFNTSQQSGPNAAFTPTQPDCPFLGLVWDKSTRYGFADQANYCHKPVHPQPVALEYQGRVCIKGDYLACPVFASEWQGKLPAEILGTYPARNRALTLRNIISICLAVIIIAAGAWFVISQGKAAPPAVAPTAGVALAPGAAAASGLALPSETASPSQTPAPSATATNLLHAGVFATNTPTPAAAGTGTIQPGTVSAGDPVQSTTPGAACINLLTPADGVKMGVSGKIDFTWSEMTLAAAYRLVIVWPSSEITRFDAIKPHLIRYLESIPNAGDYNWYVVGLDKNGNNICTSNSFSFSKKAGLPEEPTVPAGGGGGGKKGGGGGGGGGSAAGG